jgi:nucleotide-binding universal stress UspA family protein
MRFASAHGEERTMERFIQKIIVPIDFSEASEAAARYAARLAASLGASVHLIHVLEEALLAPGPLEFYGGALPQAREEMYQRACARLNELGVTLAPSGVPPFTVEVRSGVTAEEIADAVVDYGADLVVMSTHGRTGLPHLLLGSVAERVIRTARCPVLAIRGTGPAQKTSAAVESAAVA